jgi:hypothetical protein
MREVIKIRNLKERDCTTVAERCRVFRPFPSLLFAPHRALLGYAVNTGMRNSKEGPRDVRRNNTEHRVLPHVRLQGLQERLKAVQFSGRRMQEVWL